MPIDEVRTFRLKAEYRRCVIYVWIGALLCISLTILLRPIMQRGGQQVAPLGETLVVLTLFFLVMTVACLSLWRWCLRVDREGIARWWFWRWYVWPWGAFRSGEIQHGDELGQYYWPKASLAWRNLRLSLLDDSDRQEVHELCRKLCALPPEEELPEETRFRANGTRVQLHSEGVEIGRGRSKRQYAWDDVERVAIVRLERDRRDFVSLEVTLPDRTIELGFASGGRNGRHCLSVPRAALVSRWFLTRVPPERILDIDRSSPPQSREESLYCRILLENRRRVLRIARGTYLGAIVATLAICIFLPQMLFLLVPMSVGWLVFRQASQELDRQEVELNEFLASDESETGAHPVA